MFLKKISYQERALGPAGSQTWQIDDLELGQINLIVGKNSSGKSRLVNLIGNLSQLVSGKLLPRYNSGSWVVEFERMKGEAKELQLYELEVKDQLIVREQFRVGKTQIMSRARDGSGFVLNRKNTEKVKYKVPEDQLMAVVRRDEIQHPYFDQLFKWGSSLCVYRFGSDFGRNNVTAYESPYVTTDRFSMSNFSDNPAHVFKKTLERFGDEYKQLILSDLLAVGYNCSDIVLTVIPTGIVIGVPPTQLAVKEVELNCFTTQGEMSQGMFRVLALAIQINANILWAQSLMLGRSLKPGDCPMIVIDDIGEGLDFTRSKDLIKLLIQKAVNNNIQLLMSSNDRFIMNDVPLTYWTVLNRSGGVVKAFNHLNSEKKFDDFKYLGLNNFDFFSGEYYKSDAGQ